MTSSPAPKPAAAWLQEFVARDGVLGAALNEGERGLLGRLSGAGG